jgi:hypothetical protein
MAEGYVRCNGGTCCTVSLHAFLGTVGTVINAEWSGVISDYGAQLFQIAIQR